MTGLPTTDDLWSFSRAYVHDPHRSTPTRGPVAVVATDDEMYRRGCLYVAMSRPALEIDMFRELDEAQQWLAERLD